MHDGNSGGTEGQRRGVAKWSTQRAWSAPHVPLAAGGGAAALLSFVMRCSSFSALARTAFCTHMHNIQCEKNESEKQNARKHASKARQQS